MLKKIYKFIDNHIRDNIYFQIISFILLLVICFCFGMFSLIDSTPATQEDYEPLIEQQQEIATNFYTIYSYDNYTISPTDGNICVVLSNEQCKLICYFNKNLDYINHEKKDTAISKLGAIFCSIMFSFMSADVLYIVFVLFALTIISLLLKILEKICLILLYGRFKV